MKDTKKKNIIFTKNLFFFINIFILILLYLILFQINIFSQNSETDIIQKADLLLAQNNKSSAISLLLNSLKNFPESTVIPYKLGEIFYNEKIYPLALKYYLLSYKRGKIDPEIYFYIGDCYAYLNKNKKAINFFNKSLSLNPSQPYTIYSIAWILLKNKEYLKAKNLLISSIKLFPNSGYLYGALAVLYANTNEIKLSRLYYEKASSISGYFNSPVLLYNRGILEYSFGFYENAYKYFKKAFQSGDLSEVPLALGELEYLSGNFDIALQYYKMSLKNLRSPLILYDLFYLWVYRGNYSKTHEYFKKITNFQNNYWLYLYNIHVNEYNFQYYSMKLDYYTIKYYYDKRKFFKKFSFKYSINLIKDYINKSIFKLLSKIYSFTNIKKTSKFNKIEYYKTLKIIFKNISPLYKFFLDKQFYFTEKVSEKLLPELYLEYLQYYSLKKNISKFKYYENLFLSSFNKKFENVSFFNYIEAKTSLYYKKDTKNYLINLLKLLQISPQYIQFTKFKIPVKINFINFDDKNNKVNNNNGKYNNIFKIDNIKKEKKIILKYFKTKGFININNKYTNKKQNSNILFYINVKKNNNYIIIRFSLNPYFSSTNTIYSSSFNTTLEKIKKDEILLFNNLFQKEWFFEDFNNMYFHF